MAVSTLYFRYINGSRVFVDAKAGFGVGRWSAANSREKGWIMGVGILTLPAKLKKAGGNNRKHSGGRFTLTL